MSHRRSEIVTPDDGDGIGCDEVSEDSDFSDFESDEFDDEGGVSDAFQCGLQLPTNLPGHRGERVRELVATELEYVHDLELLTELTTGDTARDKYNVLDMKVLLGNMAEVIDVARRFLQELKDVAHQKEEEMVIGKIFLQFVDELSEVYKVYCSSYNVDVLPLLKKYESEETTSVALKLLAEELKLHKQHLLDLNYVLIKPVQRILKYPLYLYELVQATPESHKDFSELEDAKKSFLVAAKDINEYTRAMDLVHKYREVDHSVHGKMRRINLQSIARKSARVTRKLSQRFGMPHQVKTMHSEVKELGIKFRNVQKATEILVRNVTSLVEAVRNRHSSELVIAELLGDIFPEAAEVLKVKAAVMESCNRVLQLFDNEVQLRVLHPARQILILCEGPSNIIQKTRNIMVDYDMAQLKLQAALEPSRIAMVIEESAGIRSNYEALTKQLVAELPVFIDHCVAVLTLCTQSLISAHMYLQGHLAKLYLQLTQEPGLGFMTPEEAENKAKRRVEDLLQALPNAYQRKHIPKKKEPVKKPEKSEEVEKHDKCEGSHVEPAKVSSSSEFFKSLPSIPRGRLRRNFPVNSEQTVDQSQKESCRSSSRYEYFKSWSHSHRLRHTKSLFSVVEGSDRKTEVKPLEEQYPRDVIFTAIQEHKSEGENELTLHTGDKVAVLKKKDPMGGEERWVVDSGEKIGMVRKVCLQQAEAHTDEGERLDGACETGPSSVIQFLTNSPKGISHNYTHNESNYHEPSHTQVPPTLQQQPTNQAGNGLYISQNYSNLEENFTDSSEEWHEDGSAEESNQDVAQAVQGQNTGIVQIDNQTCSVPSQQYVVLYNFTAADSSQLTIQKGQVVVGIHTEYQDWWYVKDDYGYQGYVPASYLIQQR